MAIITIIIVALLGMGSSLPSLAGQPQVTQVGESLTLAPDGSLPTAFQIDATAAVLNSSESGIALLNRLSFSYAFPFYHPDPTYSLHARLFLGGRLSDLNTDYAPGNLQFGGKWRLLRNQRHRFTVGMDFTLPTGQSEAAIGISTPELVGYFEEAFGFEPAFYYAYSRGPFALAMHTGVDLLLLADATPPFNTAELFLDHGGGFAFRIERSLTLTAETTGITTLTSGANTDLWVGPGLIWEGASLRLKAMAAFTLLGDAEAVLHPLFRLGIDYFL